MIKKPSKTAHGLIFIFTLTILTTIAVQPSLANIDSPQGALDVAGVLPGKYAFLDRQKYPRTKDDPSETTEPTTAAALAAAPAEPAPQPQSIAQPEPTAQPNTVVAKVEESQPDPSTNGVSELMDLMKQATELAASMPEEDEATEAKSAMITPGVHAALNIVSMLPRTEFQMLQQVDPMEMIKARTMEWPADGLIYSAFNATRGKRKHGAIDIVNKKGTPIVAAADGIVSVVANGGKNFSGYGKVVIVDHGKGVHTLYAHCNSTLVKIGQPVKRGELIATMGSTGRSSTNHVHFEVRVAGKKIDPLACIPERPGVVKMTNYHTPKKKAN